MDQTSVIDQIFERYFEALKDKLDWEIIKNLKEVFGKEHSTETSLDNFVKWLKNYNAKDKKS